MREIGRMYPDAGYGGNFYTWLLSETDKAYGSFGNGSGMRVSPVAWAGNDIDEVRRLAKWSAEVTHDHPEGIKGAQAIASAVFLARTGKTKDEIREYIEENFYDLDFTLDEIRPDYSFDVTCQGSCPQAIMCFLEGEDYEDTVRNAISLGGDADTQAAITGSMAEAYFGVPYELEDKTLTYLTDELRSIYYSFDLIKKPRIKRI
jgi:type I restriction enzyme M protein